MKFSCITSTSTCRPQYLCTSIKSLLLSLSYLQFFPEVFSPSDTLLCVWSWFLRITSSSAKIKINRTSSYRTCWNIGCSHTSSLILPSRWSIRSPWNSCTETKIAGSSGVGRTLSGSRISGSRMRTMWMRWLCAISCSLFWRLSHTTLWHFRYRYSSPQPTRSTRRRTWRIIWTWLRQKAWPLYGEWITSRYRISGSRRKRKIRWMICNRTWRESWRICKHSII